MSDINDLFEAAKAMTDLETQLARLRLGLPVRRRDGGTHGASDGSSDLYHWWEMQLVRETFNQMLELTHDVAVFERMAEWLREYNRQGLADNATIALSFVRSAIDSQTPAYDSPSGRSMFDVATCVNCGCDDLNACTDPDTLQPCSWLRVDRLAGQGVCSACPASVSVWDEEAGAKTARAGT